MGLNMVLGFTTIMADTIGGVLLHSVIPKMGFEVSDFLSLAINISKTVPKPFACSTLPAYIPPAMPHILLILEYIQYPSDIHQRFT